MEAEKTALEAEDPPPPEEEDAAVLYEQAFPLLRQGKTPEHLLLDANWDRPRQALRARVAECAAALDLAERAAALDRCRFPTSWNVLDGMGPSGTTWWSGTNAWQPMWTLTWLEIARARLALEDGRLGEALRGAGRALRMGRHARYRTPAEGDAFGAHRIADLLERVLWSPGLDAATARLAKRGIPSVDVLHDGDAMAARFAALNEEALVRWFLAEPRKFRRFPPAALRTRLPEDSPLFSVSREDLHVVRESLARWTATREQARKGTLPPAEAGPWEGRIEVLRAALLIRGFQLEKGAPPARLEDLVPDWSASVPRDPLDRGPLSYQVREDGWSVWSTAPRPLIFRNGKQDRLSLRVDFPPREDKR